MCPQETEGCERQKGLEVSRLQRIKTALLGMTESIVIFVTRGTSQEHHALEVAARAT